MFDKCIWILSKFNFNSKVEPYIGWTLYLFLMDEAFLYVLTYSFLLVGLRNIH